MTEPVLLTTQADFRSFLTLPDLFSKTSTADRACCKFNQGTDGVFVQLEAKSFQGAWTQYQIQVELLTNVKKHNHNPGKYKWCFFVVGSSNNIEYYDTKNTLVAKNIVTSNVPASSTTEEQKPQEVKLWSMVEEYCKGFTQGYFLICDAQPDENSGYISGERSVMVYNYGGIFGDSITTNPLPKDKKNQGVVEVATFEQMKELVYHYGSQKTSKPDMIMVLHTSDLNDLTKLTRLDQAKPFIIASN